MTSTEQTQQWVAELARVLDPTAWDLTQVMTIGQSHELHSRQTAALETAARVIGAGYVRTSEPAAGGPLAYAYRRGFLDARDYYGWTDHNGTGEVHGAECAGPQYRCTCEEPEIDVPEDLLR